jgi:Spy/CpxP family protein refolding chaperone
MRNLWMMGVVLALCCLTAGPALAQQPKKGGGFPFGGGFGPFGGGGRGADPSALLGNPSVQKELKLTEEQQQKIPEAVQKALKEVLEPAQYKRLQQIQLQLRGTAALREADVQKKLKMTAQQKDDLKTLFTDMQNELNELRKEAQGGNFGEMFQKMRELQKETDEKVMKLLTAEQKKAWRDMTGPEFKMGGPRFPGAPGGAGAGGGAIRVPAGQLRRPLEDGTLPQIPDKGKKDA